MDEVVFFDPCQRCARFILNTHQRQCRYGDTSALHSYLLIEAMAQASGVLLSALTVGEVGGYLIGLEDTQIQAHSSSYSFAHSLLIDVVMMRANSPIFDFFARIKNGSGCIAKSTMQLMSKRTLKKN